MASQGLQRLDSSERITLAWGVTAGVAATIALSSEARRLWRDRSHTVAAIEDDLTSALESAEQTLEAAVDQVNQLDRRQLAAFVANGSFLVSLGLARGISYRLRNRASVGPFRDLRVGRRHIHHFVPGIALAFLAGGVGLVTDDRARVALAVPFGVGVGLTLDESALLLSLDDVYWTREGLIGIQISLGAISALAAAGLARVLFNRDDDARACPELHSPHQDLALSVTRR